jgi:hypothetical protein
MNHCGATADRHRPTNSSLSSHHHDINEFARQTSKSRKFLDQTSDMLDRPENVPLPSEAGEKILSTAFFALSLLTVIGWVCSLASIYLGFVAWCLCYFAQ